MFARASIGVGMGYEIAGGKTGASMPSTITKSVSSGVYAAIRSFAPSYPALPYFWEEVKELNARAEEYL